MEKKRSKGVTFWGWLFIIGSVLGLLAIMINFEKQTQFAGIGRISFNIIFSLAYVLCGFFILRLNDTARKAAIILGTVSIILLPSFLTPILNLTHPESYYEKRKQMITEQMKPEYQQKALEDLKIDREVGKKAMLIFVIAIYLIPSLIFDLSSIFFFTRPTVKEQFKKNC